MKIKTIITIGGHDFLKDMENYQTHPGWDIPDDVLAFFIIKYSDVIVEFEYDNS